MTIEQYSNDCVCWDCGGINYCFCFGEANYPQESSMLPDPICGCGKLAVTCGGNCCEQFRK